MLGGLGRKATEPAEHRRAGPRRSPAAAPRDEVAQFHNMGHRSRMLTERIEGRGDLFSFSLLPLHADFRRIGGLPTLGIPGPIDAVRPNQNADGRP